MTKNRGGSVEGVWGVLMAYVGMDEDPMEGEGGSSHLNKLVFIYFIAYLVLLNYPTSKPSTLFSFFRQRFFARASHYVTGALP